MKRLLITGGAGFIGSHLLRYFLTHTHYEIANVDCLTYSGNLSSLADCTPNPRYRFYPYSICDTTAMQQVFSEFQPDAVIHLAAESHVDRSIHEATPFIQTNVVGTAVLLDVAKHYWQHLPPTPQALFRFLHVSTDEVYGDLTKNAPRFTEHTPYAPSSPYAASKASADHLVRAWHRTYGLPTLISNCSNNYGPYQYPEKLIPLIILNILKKQPLPIYGDGLQIRDWLHVEDHARALHCILEQGRIGQSYNIGASTEKTNLDLVHFICQLLDEMHPWQTSQGHQSYQQLIHFISDRPGHDLRYAIDATKLKTELGWEPQIDFATGLRKTIQWYIHHPDWWQPLLRQAAHND